jgi:ELWxxDGT repeat protein
MLTSFTVPLITPFEPSEETELENQFQRYETTTSDTSVAVMLKDIRTGFASSSISQIRVVPGPNGVDHTVFFKANNGTSGEELWKSDGTPEGTMIVKDINTGGGGAGIDHLTVVGSTLFFIANDGSNSAELWKSDGTSAGTVMVKDINPGSNSSDPNFLTAVGDLLFFRAVHPSSGCELWVSDGTSNGTFMLKDIYSGAHPNNGYPESLTAVGNNLYFTVYNTGYQLWKSNGTTAGTTLVKIIASTSGRAAELTAMGNTLFFSAQSPAAGTSTGDELWASEGTDNSTWMVKDINPGSSSSSPERLAAVGNTIYFHATDGTNGYELWKSNGTSSGTMMVKNIMSGAGSSSPATLTAVGNTLYFQANDGTNGFELWKSDGTSTGTAMVKDIRVGSAGSSAGYFSASGSTLYFDANDGINGHELWKTDGTSGGTVMVDDIHLGVNSSNPQRVSISDSGVGYFKADNGVNGVELWKVIDNPCYINGTIINNATEWVHCVGGNNEDVEVASVAVDSSGNTYYTGSFGDFVLFGDIPLYSSGGSDIFVAKLNSSGSWQWAIKAGSSTHDEGMGIALDSSGHAYVTGYFKGTATFGSTSLTSSGSQDIFIAKLSSSGSWQWVVKAGGSSNDYGKGIAVDSSGNAYVTGIFQGTATFGSTSLTSSGSQDIFIAKLSSSGSWQWAVKAGGSTSNDWGNSIGVDSSGNSYVTGEFGGTMLFGSISITSSGSSEIFIAKLSSTGSWQWAVKAGGSSTDKGKGIAIDSSGNAYAIGSFQGTATFGSTSLTSSAYNDIFVAKLSSSGSWQWVVKAGGSSSDNGMGIAVDSSGNAYVTGYFLGTATFGNTSLTSNGGSDAFIGQVDSSGNWVWANNGGGTGSDEGTSIALGSAGIGYK